MKKNYRQYCTSASLSIASLGSQLHARRDRAHTMVAAVQRLKAALFLTLLIWSIIPTTAEILTPPYFNLALGKRITATATCGDEGPELYCKLVGANADQEEHVIQGQVNLIFLN